MHSKEMNTRGNGKYRKFFIELGERERERRCSKRKNSAKFFRIGHGISKMFKINTKLNTKN